MNISYPKLDNSFIKSILFVFLLCCYSLQGLAQIVVEMKLDSAEILVGQHVNLSTTVSADATKSIHFPSFKEGEEIVKGLEVIKESQVDTAYLNNNKRIQLHRNYTITSFDSALYNIPPIGILVDGDTVKAKSSVGLKVNLVPVDTTKIDQFAGPHEVVPGVFTWRNRLIIQSFLLWGIILFIVSISIKLTRRKPLIKKKVIKSQITPYKQASAIINPLKSKLAHDHEDIKKVYIALTDALRVYLYRRYDVYALEMTTDEILLAIAGKINEQEKENLKFIFQTADLVKFAKYSTSEFEMKRCFDTADDFLVSTKSEILENPQPEVQILILNDGMQTKYRLVLWFLFYALLLCGFFYTCYLSNSIYSTFN